MRRELSSFEVLAHIPTRIGLETLAENLIPKVGTSEFLRAPVSGDPKDYQRALPKVDDGGKSSGRNDSL